MCSMCHSVPKCALFSNQAVLHLPFPGNKVCSIFLCMVVYLSNQRHNCHSNTYTSAHPTNYTCANCIMTNYYTKGSTEVNCHRNQICGLLAVMKFWLDKSSRREPTGCYLLLGGLFVLLLIATTDC